jgi:hypothetical protein
MHDGLSTTSHTSYEWNSEIAAAFLRDLGHLEVAVRNAYDRALLTHPDILDVEWLTATSCALLFPPYMANDQNGNPQDKNATPRANVKDARRHSGFDAGVVPRGKAVAEMMFGFWSYLTDDLHEKSLWVPGSGTGLRGRRQEASSLTGKSGHSLVSSTSSSLARVTASGQVRPERMSYSVERSISASRATSLFDCPLSSTCRRRAISTAYATTFGVSATKRPSGHSPVASQSRGVRYCWLLRGTAPP